MVPESSTPDEEVNRLLKQISDGAGDPEVQQRLLDAVHTHLRQIARRLMRSERANHTLQPTALVNEAWLKLGAAREQNYQSRAHFINCAAVAMRQILLDHARTRLAGRRQLDTDAVLRLKGDAVVRVEPLEMLALDQALTRLAERDRHLAHLVELRCFAELSVEETASVLRLSVSTVKRQWQIARTMLMQELDPGVRP